jgi:flagellar biosynthesis protein
MNERKKRAAALRYQPGRQDAPIMTAKGQGYTAEKILQLAKEHGIPVQQDPSLVEILSHLEVGAQIPPELYQVVAEILAFVYQIDRKMKSQTP